jgi:hypothetical protein
MQSLARSERFELPTPRFEVWCSIQLSYERACAHHSGFGANVTCFGRASYGSRNMSNWSVLPPPPGVSEPPTK